MTDTTAAKNGPMPVASNNLSKSDNNSTTIVKTTPAMGLPKIRPEHMIYPTGDVILAFPEHPPSGRPQRKSTQPSVFIRASSAALYGAYVLHCMVRDAKRRCAGEYASNGFVTIDLPMDDWQAFTFLLLIIRGATEEEMDRTFFDILTLVQLATLIDKYDLTDIIEPHGDYFISRARQSDPSVMRRLAVYIWVAQVFEASKSHWELTAMAQTNCIGFKKYKFPDVNLEEETTVTPLPKWVMDGILKKRLAAFTIIQASLIYSEKDCYIRAEKSHAVGDIADFYELPFQLRAIDQLSNDLGVPLSGKVTEKKMHGVSFNGIVSRLNELRHKPLEHSCKISGETECLHKSLQAVVALAATGLKAASQRNDKLEEKTFVFDPVGHILERLSSSDAWEEQGSTLGWGFGLLNAAKVETKSDKPDDVVSGKVLKRKRI